MGTDPGWVQGGGVRFRILKFRVLLGGVLVSALAPGTLWRTLAGFGWAQHTWVSILMGFSAGLICAALLLAATRSRLGDARSRAVLLLALALAAIVPFWPVWLLPHLGGWSAPEWSDVPWRDPVLGVAAGIGVGLWARLWSRGSARHRLKRESTADLGPELNTAIAEVMAASEISGSIQAHGLSEAVVRGRLATHATQDQLVSSGWKEYEQARTRLSQRRKAISGNTWRIVISTLGGLAIALTMISPFIAIWNLLYSWTGSNFWSVVLGSLVVVVVAPSMVAAKELGLGIYLVLAYISVIGLGVAYFGSVWGIAYLAGLVGVPVMIYLDDKKALSLTPVPAASPSEVAAALTEWRRAIREHSLIPTARMIINMEINTRKESKFGVKLAVRDRAGLRQPNLTKYHIPTAAKEDLFRLLDEVDGGCFAIAGPRGSGKTMLVRALFEGRYQRGEHRDLAVFAAAPVRYDPKDFVLHLYATFCREVIDYARSTHGISGRARRRQLPFRWVRPTGLALLADEAAQRRLLVSHLLKVSTEASGALKFGFGEAGGKTSAEISRQPLTYPEAVADFVDFLRRVAGELAASPSQDAKPRVVVCIDELDRLGSGDKAQEFLNEIKAIFTASNCYFLVSVSEDALRSFELKGYGVRDVFDSTFDEVIRLDYLDQSQVHQMLDERVIGFPVPFQAMVFCLSGGLPREVLRVTRTITRSDEGASIAATAAAFAREELRSVCRAAASTVLPDEATTNEFLRCLNEAPEQITDLALTEFAQRLTKPSDGVDQVAQLRETIRSTALFLGTVVGFFSSQLDSALPIDVRERAIRAEHLNALAKARRQLGINDAYAYELLSDFRRTWNMAPL